MQVSLAGKVAVVTGASSGIGLAVTKAYLEADAAGVIAVFRRPDFPNELTDCQTRYGKKLIVVNGDVAEEATAQDFTRAAVDHFGRLDLVVSNAAVSVVKALHEHTSEEWDYVMNSNVKALFWTARHVIPVMQQQRKGLILVSGSISGEALVK